MFNFNRKILKLAVAPSVALLVTAGCTQQPLSPDKDPPPSMWTSVPTPQPGRPDALSDHVISTDSPQAYSLARR